MTRFEYLLLAAGLVVAAAACDKVAHADRQAADPAAAREAQYDRVLVSPELRVVVRGIRYAQLQADSMFVNEDSTTALLFGARFMMLDTAGNHIAELRSGSARYNLRTQKLVAFGNPVLVGPAAGRITSDTLHFDPEAHRIWSDVATRVQWAGGGTTTFATFTVDDRFVNPKGTSARGPQRGRL